MTNAVETVGLCYRPGKDFEISDVNMRIPAGAVYGFLGPNGSGKTTVVRLLMGMHKADKGDVYIFDREVPKDMTPILERTAYVPERPHLYPTLTVHEAVKHHAAFHPHWESRWAESLFDRFTLAPHRRVSSLSKGETGKLMMLLALGQRPDLLILDEPTEGLDPVVRREIMSVLLEYVTDRNATVLISSHLIHELERFCNWVGIMDMGRLVAEMRMDDFKNGLKRLRVLQPEPNYLSVPFEILHREPNINGGPPGETWLVRGWNPSMAAFFTATSSTLREVIDLDLEDGFVELLRAFRSEMQRS